MERQLRIRYAVSNDVKMTPVPPNIDNQIPHICVFSNCEANMQDIDIVTAAEEDLQTATIGSTHVPSRRRGGI